MKPSTFYFRVDASEIIGIGHFMRSLNLALDLKKRGAKVVFFSRNLPENFSADIERAGCKLYKLIDINGSAIQKPEQYETWLGASEQDDIFQCLNFISNEDNFSFVVDHYGVKEQWIEIAKKTGGKLIFFDDLAERKLDVDIIINQNLGWKECDYIDLIGQETRLLLGPKYAILSDSYVEIRQKLKRHFEKDSPIRVLVSLGGADVNNISGRIAIFLKKIQTKIDLTVTIIVGPMNPNIKKLQKICQDTSGKIQLLKGQNNLASVYANSDIAIGAVGGSSWERCCLGLPTILVPIAENQMPAAKKLHDIGAGILVNFCEEQFEEELNRALQKICDPGVRKKISKIASEICDGKGSSRISQEIIGLNL